MDITNYVMLEYGQPMHAFDFKCVEGGKLVIRTAREGETLLCREGKNSWVELKSREGAALMCAAILHG